MTNALAILACLALGALTFISILAAFVDGNGMWLILSLGSGAGIVGIAEVQFG